MINFADELGQRTWQRINSEQVIWLTTVTPDGIPQPRPVWFIWDGEAFIIYSSPTAWKIKHIAHNPHVSLNFNTGSDGEDIQVILGIAHIDPNGPPVKQVQAYLDKYRQGIFDIGMTEDSYSAVFRTALRVIPTRLRGLSPLPEA